MHDNITIETIIEMAGGAPAIARKSHSSERPITLSSAYKWKLNGIPCWHWDLVIRLSGVSIETIHNANKARKK